MLLKPGDQAPDFVGKNHAGETIQLADFKGKKLVFYFYPKDDTPGCTAEACNLRDNYELLMAKGYAVVGISSNNEKQHLKFREKYSLPFPLIADIDKAIHESYGTWVEKSMYGRKYMGTARVTFIVDEAGLIQEVIEKVDTKNHTAQIVK